MNEENNKKKKRSELIAIEIEEKETQFNKIIEESRKILSITQKEFDNTIYNAEAKLIKSRKDIILEAGRYLEKNLEIVTNNSPNQICKMLKQKFTGIVSATQIWYYCPEKWKVSGRVQTGRKGGLATQRLELQSVENNEPLTEYEKKYAKVHEDKVSHNENVEYLINYYLGMTQEEKTAVFSKAKKAGLEYHNALIENAYDNMLRIVKSLNDADIPALLADIRFLKQIMTKVADMALNEHEQRKKNKEMMNA